MAQNRGKQFETVIKEAFEKLDGVSIDRLHDQTTGFIGSSNMCDFIVYREPNEIYLECKSCHGNTLPLSNITDTQWNGLLKKSRIEGVIAGVIVWFIDHDRTIFIPIQHLQDCKERGGKSIQVKYIDCDEKVVEIFGRKKRVFFEYDLQSFLDEVQSGKS